MSTEKQLTEHLLAIADHWMQCAKRAFYDADFEEDPMGKRLIIHGAMHYFNGATTLKEALAHHEQETLQALLKDRTLLRRLCLLLCRQLCSKMFRVLRLG